MRPLEFDVLARSFADGFSRALTALFNSPIQVGVRLRNGHLETIKTRGQAETRRTHLDYSFDYAADWHRRVKPAVQAHIRHVAGAGYEAHGPRAVATLLSDVSERMVDVTYLHHTLVLPARLKLVEFSDYVCRLGLMATTAEAMCLLAGHRNASTALAIKLWEGRHTLDDQVSFEQEGDGYGLGSATWLEDPMVPNHVRRLYQSLDDRASPAVLLASGEQRGTMLQAAVEQALRSKPEEIRSICRRLWTEATTAMWVTEEHAPLMHARLPHELRALVVRLGAMLAGSGWLDRPDDIFYLHIDELACDASAEPSFLQSQASRHREDIEHAEPLIADEVTGSGDTYGDSEAALLFRRLFRSANRTRTASGLSGHPGSPGRGVGRVRRLFWQSDIAAVQPGEVLVTPESAAGWSFAVPAATAVVSESGHPYGHLASLARDYATPAVIGVGDTRDVLWDGRLVEVDGVAGEVRLLADTPQEDAR